MLDTTLSFLRDRINDYINIKTGDSGDKIVLSNILGPEGSSDHLPTNSLIITLIKVEEEKMARSAPPHVEKIEGNYFGFSPEINLNLYLMISAHFAGQSDQYIESLKLLSHALSYFQLNPIFSKIDSPLLPESIERLAIELINPSFEMNNQIWGMIGAKYMPCVLYKIRMVTIKEEQIKTEVPVIEEIDVTLNG